MMPAPRRRYVLWPLVAAITWAAGCTGEKPRERQVREEPPTTVQAPAVPAMHFDSGTVVLTTASGRVRLSVEIAATESQHEYGLMNRDSLGAHAGMVFVYGAPQPPDASFWMFHTRIPLDIAFADSSGRIVAIRAMDPCFSPDPDQCPKYPPLYAYSSALEVNHGYFREHGVEVGDRLRLIRPGDTAR